MGTLRATWQWSALTLAALAVTGVLWRQAGAQQERDQAGADTGVEVMTRGPVHEAFGEPVTFDPTPGIIVPKQPPQAIEELPPEEKPEGQNVAWIPGYWGWDEPRQDFLWISGFWRDVPPGRQWVAGYWRQAENGYQWISGFWAPTEQQELTYLPPPPASLEAGPSTEAPAADYLWAPGCWTWYETRYVWRPGFWLRGQPDWVWVPAQYMWTPCGCVFVDGFWDHAVPLRGLLFAPVYVQRDVYTRPGFIYSPAVVVNTEVLTEHLFVQPRYHHYCFGDYYEPSYLRSEIFPCFSYHYSRYGYDPIYAHVRWVNERRDPRWEQRVREEFQQRRDHREARPPQTFVALQKMNVNNRNVAAMTLRQFAAAGTQQLPFRLERLDRERRTEITKHVKEVHQVATQRVRLETEAARRPAPQAQEARPLTLKLPASPVAARPVQHLDKEKAPPPPPKAPKAVPTVQTKSGQVTRPRPEERLESPKGKTETPRTPREVSRPESPPPRETTQPELPKQPKVIQKTEPLPTPKEQRPTPPPRPPKETTQPELPKQPKAIQKTEPLPKEQRPLQPPKEVSRPQPPAPPKEVSRPEPPRVPLIEERVPPGPPQPPERPPDAKKAKSKDRERDG